jgi:O-acetyl-ADP-ribose deacetylase (regulator of RNase III)
MIEFGEGNLLHANVDALVNTVNTVGVMGKGVALQFKQAYPANFTAYKQACDKSEIRIGRTLGFSTSDVGHGLVAVSASRTYAQTVCSANCL